MVASLKPWSMAPQDQTSPKIDHPDGWTIGKVRPSGRSGHLEGKSLVPSFILGFIFMFKLAIFADQLLIFSWSYCRLAVLGALGA